MLDRVHTVGGDTVGRRYGAHLGELGQRDEERGVREQGGVAAMIGMEMRQSHVVDVVVLEPERAELRREQAWGSAVRPKQRAPDRTGGGLVSKLRVPQHLIGVLQLSLVDQNGVTEPHLLTTIQYLANRLTTV